MVTSQASLLVFAYDTWIHTNTHVLLSLYVFILKSLFLNIKGANCLFMKMGNGNYLEVSTSTCMFTLTKRTCKPISCIVVRFCMWPAIVGVKGRSLLGLTNMVEGRSQHI